MSYLDKFGGTGEAYYKLPVFEAHKKIKEGEITPQEATTLAIAGAMVCLNALMEEKPPVKKINDYEKYLVIKGNSTEKLKKEDAGILIALAKEIGFATANEELDKEGELGAFISTTITLAKTVAEEMQKSLPDYDKLEEILTQTKKQAELFRGHAEAILALKPQFGILDEDEISEIAEAVKSTVEHYALYIIGKCEFVEKTSKMYQKIEKKDPYKEELNKKTPEDIKNEVESGTYSPDKRKKLVKSLERNFSPTDVDGFEKLLWLDERGETSGKLLAQMKNLYLKNSAEGKIGSRVKSIRYDLQDAPKIPSRNIFWNIVIMLLSLAMAGLVAFHPAVTAFFAGAEGPILGILWIIIFFVGAGYGGFVAGIIAVVAFTVVTYLIQLLIPFYVILKVVVALALLIPMLFAGADISSHSKKAVKEAKAERRRFYEKLLVRCDDAKSYIVAIREKISADLAEFEGASAALKYYDNLKTRVEDTSDTINSYIKMI